MAGHENNAALLERAKQGDCGAESELVMCNMGLVKSIAARFMGRGEELDDLIQLGSIGLLKAARGYDPSYGTVFSTYAVPMIIGEIRRFLRDSGPIKVGRSVKQLGMKIAREREIFIMEKGREPTVGELSAILETTPEEIVNAMDACAPTISLQEILCGDDSADNNTGFALESVVGGNNAQNDIENLVEEMSLASAIESLDDNERTIVNLRYRKGLTQTQTGQLLGISQVKVSRMEKKIMQKLKNKLVC